MCIASQPNRESVKTSISRDACLCKVSSDTTTKTTVTTVTSVASAIQMKSDFDNQNTLSAWGFTDNKCHNCGQLNSDLNGLLLQCQSVKKHIIVVSRYALFRFSLLRQVVGIISFRILPMSFSQQTSLPNYSVSIII
jgi:hypothetical protein